MHEKGRRTPARGHPTTLLFPRPYYIRLGDGETVIVGTGVRWMWGWAPCGRPSGLIHRAYFVFS
jgi:hypothetical protein